MIQILLASKNQTLTNYLQKVSYSAIKNCNKNIAAGNTTGIIKYKHIYHQFPVKQEINIGKETKSKVTTVSTTKITSVDNTTINPSKKLLTLYIFNNS